MKRFNVLMLIVLLIALMTAVTIAENVSLPNVGIAIEIPNGWFMEMSEEEGEGYYVLSPDEEISISISFLDASLLKDALESVEEEFFADFEEVEYTEQKEIEINGMESIACSCDFSTEDDFDGTMMFMLIKSPKNGIVFLYSIIDNTRIKKYFETIKKIFNSSKASE